MSGAHGPKGLTRRSFLKTTGAAGVAAVAAGAAAPQLAAIAEGYEPGQPETQGEQIFRGVCRPNWGYVSKSVSFGIIHCLYLVGIWNSSQTIPVPCSSGAPSSRFDSLDTAANSPSTSSSVGMTRRISAAGSGLSVCA